MKSTVTKENKNKTTKETQKFISKIQPIYVPIHGKHVFNDLFDNLDDYHLDFIIDIINELRLKNTYIIIVSHDDTLATKIDHDEIILDKGKIKCTN